MGGSFFEAVPAGADVYLAVQVLHNWNDDAAARILDRVRDAAAAGGRLLLIEVVVPEGEPGASAFADVLSMMWLGGAERTEAQWRRLLRRGGFRVEAITPGDRVCAIEARPD